MVDRCLGVNGLDFEGMAYIESTALARVRHKTMGISELRSVGEKEKKGKKGDRNFKKCHDLCLSNDVMTMDLGLVIGGGQGGRMEAFIGKLATNESLQEKEKGKKVLWSISST